MDKHKSIREWDFGLPPPGVIVHWCVEWVEGSGIDDDRCRSGEVLGGNYNRHGDDLNAVLAGKMTG